MPTECAITQISDGQPQVPRSCSKYIFSTMVPAKPNPQVQPSKPTAPPAPSSNPSHVSTARATPINCFVTQIQDGQPQFPASCTNFLKSTHSVITLPKSVITSQKHQGDSVSRQTLTSVTSSPSTAGCPITQIGDGQIQAPASCSAMFARSSSAPHREDSTTEAEASCYGATTTMCSTKCDSTPTGKKQTDMPASCFFATKPHCPVTQIGDGQIQAPASCLFLTQLNSIQSSSTAARFVTKTPDERSRSTLAPAQNPNQQTAVPSAGKQTATAVSSTHLAPLANRTQSHFLPSTQTRFRPTPKLDTPEVSFGRQSGAISMPHNANQTVNKTSQGALDVRDMHWPMVLSTVQFAMTVFLLYHGF